MVARNSPKRATTLPAEDFVFRRPAGRVVQRETLHQCFARDNRDIAAVVLCQLQASLTKQDSRQG